MEKNKDLEESQRRTNIILNRLSGLFVYVVLALALLVYYLVDLEGIAYRIINGVTEALLTILSSIYICHFCYHNGKKINRYFGYICLAVGLVYSLIFFITMYILIGVSPDEYQTEISFCYISMYISFLLGLIASLISPLKEMSINKPNREFLLYR